MITLHPNIGNSSNHKTPGKAHDHLAQDALPKESRQAATIREFIKKQQPAKRGRADYL
ncbi:MAG TPA: hypothetical protein PK969_13220 [Treponemataceae bacterium]|jgi:hypothetical protein|nr:hypothetical protein [Treponemataceae bacterium]